MQKKMKKFEYATREKNEKKAFDGKN